MVGYAGDSGCVAIEITAYDSYNRTIDHKYLLVFNNNSYKDFHANLVKAKETYDKGSKTTETEEFLHMYHQDYKDKERAGYYEPFMRNMELRFKIDTIVQLDEKDNSSWGGASLYFDFGFFYYGVGSNDDDPAKRFRFVDIIGSDETSNSYDLSFSMEYDYEMLQIYRIINHLSPAQIQAKIDAKQKETKAKKLTARQKKSEVDEFISKGINQKKQKQKAIEDNLFKN